MAQEISDFSNVVTRILNSWSTLHFAVDQGFGGIYSREKAAWLNEIVSNFFLENEAVEFFEVADFIAEILDNEFNLRIEDGSLEEISNNLCQCFDLFRRKNFIELQAKLFSLPELEKIKNAVGRSTLVDEEKEENTEEIEEMDTNEDENGSTSSETRNKPPAKIVDEDGFMLVQSKRKNKS